MNKLSKLILMLPLALAPLAGQAAPKGGSHAALAAGFVAPPDSVQTSVYWYWLSGNVSKANPSKKPTGQYRTQTEGNLHETGSHDSHA